MKSFPSAAFIQEKMKSGEVFATVVEGKFKDTIGKVIRVERIHYDRHNYFLEISGKSHKFCGSILKESSTHEVSLVHDDKYRKEYRDFNDRLIANGNTIIITKQSSKNSTIEVIIGNVRKIDDSGIFVEPFAVNGTYMSDNAKYIRIIKTNTAIVLDSSTASACMVQRLSAQ